LAKRQKTERVRFRTAVQLFVAAASNSWVTGFAAGRIYQGDLKQLCHPGLNCYSCPGALLSCPIGALQAVIGSRSFSLSLYVFGFLLLVGATLGRMVCGFLCPFGLVQELVYKIPFPFKKNHFKADRLLRYVKYLMLLVMVILLPMVLNNAAGEASPTFCKYVCPAGTLEAGIPLVYFSPADAGLPADTGTGQPALPGMPPVKLIARDGPRFETGALFALKMGILAATILACLVIYRPFCKYICPLGAAYALLNPVSLYRLRLNEDKCIHCGACARACKMCLDPTEQLNHPECVRCGDCVNACPTDAISMGFGEKKAGKALNPGKETV
jgi:polyferredoxin